jgi:predicted RNase H-like HicB family nuclease
MTQYLVIYEQGPDSWGAYSPDLPGCTAVGSSRDEVEQLMREAVEAHVDVLRSEGLAMPQPRASPATSRRKSRHAQASLDAGLQDAPVRAA